MFMSSCNSYIEILTSQVMVVRDGAYRRLLGHEGEALLNGIIALIKEAAGNLFVPSTMWGLNKKVQFMVQGKALPDTKSAGGLILDFP